MANKIYTTLRQQLKILRSKNMNISINGQGAKVKKILERENYYSVINGYKDPFIQTSSNNETFISNTQFENLYTLFTFDRNVRLIHLKFILKIEHQIKSVIAHEFSKKYGHDNYLKLGNFDILDNQNCNKKDNNKIKKVLTTIGKLETSLSNQMNKNKEITHYMSTYGYVPLWVLVNILTLGEISYFYSNMKPGDKNNVARVFNVNPEEFSKYIKNLTLSRNLCAHDERFYDFKYRESLSTSYISNFSLFSIPSKNGNYLYGTNDAFSIAVIFSQLLPKKDIQIFIKSMDKEFKTLDKNLDSSIFNKIKIKMGFGNSWKKLRDICR